MINDQLFPVLDEQASVGFTGKVNILNPVDSRLLGAILMMDGEVVDASFGGLSGLKAFLNASVAAFEDGRAYKYIVEPELVQGPRKIHYPSTVLRRKVAELVALYKANKGLQPPEHMKLLINPQFVEEGSEVSAEEFQLMCTMADHNRVKDIYKNCELLDYQITNALVSLRKKGAITTVAQKR